MIDTCNFGSSVTCDNNGNVDDAQGNPVRLLFTTSINNAGFTSGVNQQNANPNAVIAAFNSYSSTGSDNMQVSDGLALLNGSLNIGGVCLAMRNAANTAGNSVFVPVVDLGQECTNTRNFNQTRAVIGFARLTQLTVTCGTPSNSNQVTANIRCIQVTTEPGGGQNFGVTALPTLVQ